MKTYRIYYTNQDNKTLSGILSAKNSKDAQRILEAYPGYKSTTNIIHLPLMSESLFSFNELSLNAQNQALKDLDKVNLKELEKSQMYLTYNESLANLKINGLFTSKGILSV